MSSGISPLTSSSVTLPLSGSRSRTIFSIASFQIQRSSIEKRMTSMLSGTPLWSRSQTSTGAIVPTSATARSRKTPFGSFCAWSPSWLASSSRMASALPIENGLKVWLSFRPEATMKFSTRTSSSRPKRRASAITLPNRSRSALPSTSTKPDPCASALVSRLRIAVVLPAPVVPGMAMCCRASSAVTQSSWPVMLQPMKKVPFAGLGLREPGVGLLTSGQAADRGRRIGNRTRRVSTQSA